MAIGLRVRVIGGREYDRALAAHTPSSNPRIAATVLRTAALRTQDVAAREEIISGGNQPPHPTRLTSRSGTGRRSISVNLAGLPNFSEAGSDLGYMAAHEKGGTFGVPVHTVSSHRRTVVFGRRVSPPFMVPSFQRGPYTMTLPRREWLRPATDKVVRELQTRAADLVERATRRGR